MDIEIESLDGMDDSCLTTTLCDAMKTTLQSWALIQSGAIDESKVFDSDSDFQRRSG